MTADLAPRPPVHRCGRRFAITTSLVYREHGSLKWRTGATVNVSHSGVLFRIGGAPPPVAQRLDFVLALPLTGGSPAARVRCTGHVVRTEPSPFVEGGTAVAVAIDAYALEGRSPP
jgi:hypothetical protein